MCHCIPVPALSLLPSRFFLFSLQINAYIREVPPDTIDIIDIVLIIQVGLASFSFPFLFFIYLFFWVKYFSLRFYYFVLLLIFTQQADHKPLLHNTQNKWGPIKTLFNFGGLTDRPIKLGPSRLVDLLFHETSLVSFIYLFYFFS